MLSQIIDEQNKLLLEKEQRITDLEKELEQAKKVQVVERFEAYGQCRDSRRIASLEKENDELKKECRRCVHTDCPCILSDYGKDRNGICDHFKDVFDENAELNDKLNNLASVAEVRLANWQKYEKENKELKELVEKYRQAVDKCLHITFMGGGCEVNTIGQYATLVDGYLTDVEGLAKWKD